MNIKSFNRQSQDKEKQHTPISTLKFHQIKILIIGLESVGTEIAKNIVLLQPDVITLCDQTYLTAQDLDYNPAAMEINIGKQTRAQMCEILLRGLSNDQTVLRVFEHDITVYIEQVQKNGSIHLDSQFLNQIDNHDLIVVADVLNLQLVNEINKHLRDNSEKNNNKKFNQGIIWCGTIGLYTYLFEDYGLNFKVYDKDGQQPISFNIQAISKSNPGVIRVTEQKPIDFQTGDFICVHDVEGMVEVNGSDPRPIKVISPYEFTLEDTTNFSKYISGGVAQRVKVPFRMKFNPIDQQFVLPQIDKVKYYRDQPSLLQQVLSAHSFFLSLIEVIQSSSDISKYNLTSIAEQKFSTLVTQLANLRQQNIETIVQVDNTVTLDFNQQQSNVLENHNILQVDWHNLKFDGQISEHLQQDYKQKLFQLVNLWGGIVSLEIVNFTGKYTPQATNPQLFEFYSKLDNDRINMEEKKVQSLKWAKDLFEQRFLGDRKLFYFLDFILDLENYFKNPYKVLKFDSKNKTLLFQDVQ